MTARPTGLGWPSESTRPEQRPAAVSGGRRTGLGWPEPAPSGSSSGTPEDEPARATPAAGTTGTTGTTGTENAETGALVAADAATEPTDVSREAAEPTAEPDVSRETSDTPIADAARLAARARGGWLPELPRPAHTRVIAVANQKGGVGKTTTTVNLAAALAQHGARVLVLDLDPQGNASTALGIDHHAEVPSVYEVLVEGRDLAEVAQPVAELPGLLCVPATIDLAGAEIELVSLVARESRLQRGLNAYLRGRAGRGEPSLDYVLVDCPPSLGLLTVNALVAAEEVLIPIQCEYYALEGLGQLLRNIELVKSHLNPVLHVSTILLTMYDARTRLAAQVADEVREHFAGTVLQTTIPRSVRISEAPSHGKTVLTYDPASSGALSYLEAARELAHHPGPGAPVP